MARNAHALTSCRTLLQRIEEGTAEPLDEHEPARLRINIRILEGIEAEMQQRGLPWGERY